MAWNIFDRISGNLTKPNTALEAANGARVVLDSPEQTLQVANEALNALPEQNMTVTPTEVASAEGYGDGIPPRVQFSGGQPMFDTPDASKLPKIVQPSYMEASTDAAGNVKNSKALTKGGVLLNILRGGLQGGLDAMAGGALDAPRNGESSFGKGLMAAQQMPIYRENLYQQQQARQMQMANQQQEAQAKAQMLPWLQRKTQADALASEAEAKMRSAQAEAYQALATQREATPDQKYAALDAIAQKYGIQRGTPEYNKFVLGLDAPKQDMSVSPFEAWRAQNPNAPVADYYKMTNTFRHTGNADGKTPMVNDVSQLSPEQQSLVDEIGSGKMALNRLDYILARNPNLLAAVSLKYPDFDSSKVKAYIDTYKSFTGNGADAVQLTAGATAMRHLAQLKRIYDENPYKVRMYGSEAYVRFHNLLDTVADELMTFYKEPKTNEAIASKKATLGALFNRDSGIREQAAAMGERFDELEQKWRNAAPSARYQAPMPGYSKEAIDARAFLDDRYAQRLRGQQGSENPNPPQNPTPQAKKSSNGEGMTATGPNGHKIVVRNGKWVDAQTGQPIQ